MNFNKFFSILFLGLSSCNILLAQEAWKSKFGIWINVELDRRLNQPFDSISHIMPRFLWINSLKEIELENRFEQKRKYPIKKVTKKLILTKDAQLILEGDTIIFKDNYRNVIKFVKYKKYK